MRRALMYHGALPRATRKPQRRRTRQAASLVSSPTVARHSRTRTSNSLIQEGTMLKRLAIAALFAAIAMAADLTTNPRAAAAQEGDRCGGHVTPVCRKVE